jgi:hypothetical protein
VRHLTFAARDPRRICRLLLEILDIFFLNSFASLVRLTDLTSLAVRFSAGLRWMYSSKENPAWLSSSPGPRSTTAKPL